MINELINELANELMLENMIENDFNAIMRALINEFMVADEDDALEDLDMMIFRFAHDLAYDCMIMHTPIDIMGMIQNTLTSI